MDLTLKDLKIMVIFHSLFFLALKGPEMQKFFALVYTQPQTPVNIQEIYFKTAQEVILCKWKIP